MSFESVRPISLEVLSASADIPQGRFVTFKATNGLSLPAVAGDSDSIVGVTLEAYDDSEADLDAASTVIPVAMLDGTGKVEVEAGAAIVLGARVIAGNDGRAITSTTTAGGTVPAGVYQEIGIAEEAAGAAAEFITIIPIRGPFVTTV